MGEFVILVLDIALSKDSFRGCILHGNSRGKVLWSWVGRQPPPHWTRHDKDFFRQKTDKAILRQYPMRLSNFIWTFTEHCWRIVERYFRTRRSCAQGSRPWKCNRRQSRNLFRHNLHSTISSFRAQWPRQAQFLHTWRFSAEQGA